MTTATLNPSEDTFVHKSLSNYNFGINTFVNIAGGSFAEKSLIRFDLSSLPSSPTISTAKISFVPPGDEGSKTYNIYEISDANGDWIEGTKQVTTAGIGEPCWNYKEYNTVSWSGSSGLSTAGTDYVNTVLATYTGALSADTRFEISFNASGIALLEGWAGQASNNGFLIVTGDSNSTSFHSIQSASIDKHPELVIEYSLGGLLKINMNAQMKDMVGGMNG